MANGWLIDQEIDLQQPVSRQYTMPYGIAMTGDDRGQRLRYTVYDGSAAASLAGTLKAYFRRPDDVLIECTSGGDYVDVTSNVITIQPPPEAYAKRGNVECIVKLYDTNGPVITIARCDLLVQRGVEQDDTVIPAGEASRASLEDRVAAIEAATGVVPIDQLPDLPHTPTIGDLMIVDDGNGPYKIDYNALATAILAKLGGDPVTVQHGGSGLTASPSLLVNLESTTAVNIMQASPRPGITGELPVANGGTGASTAAAALAALGGFGTADVSDIYSASATYDEGDYCIHDNTLYRCTTEITTAEEWTAAHWSATTIDVELQRRVKFEDVVNNLTNGETRPVSSGAVYAAMPTVEEDSAELSTTKYGSFYYGGISTDTRNIIAATVIGSTNNMFATVQIIDSQQNGNIRVFGDSSGGTVYIRILRKSS